MVKRPSRYTALRLVSLLAGLAVSTAMFLVSGSLTSPARAIPAQQNTPTPTNTPDVRPTVGFDPRSYSVNESDGSVELTVTVLTGSIPANREVDISYVTVPGTAQEGSDFTRAEGILTLTNTVEEETIEVTINSDSTSEGNEQFSVSLTVLDTTVARLELNSRLATVTIIDDDPITATPATRVFVDDAEPNETFDQAFTIAAEAAATCGLSLWPPGDIDFYRFSVKAGDFYRVFTDDLDPGLDTVLEVYNTTGGKVAENDDVSEIGQRRSEVAIQADANGFFFARIVNKDPGDLAGLTYCFQVDAIAQPTPTLTPTLLPTRQGSDACEPNGSLELACLIGENQQGNFNFIPPFNEGPDTDFYRLWVRPGITYTCETTQLSDVADTNIIFLDANGGDFNPQLGNNDKDINDRGSRLSYLSTYTGYLHIVVGPVNPVPLSEAPRHTYTLTCISSVAPTAVPTLPPRTPAPPGPGGGFQSPTPLATPLPSPTPFDFSFLTPSPVVPPAVTIQPLPTATPFAGGQQAATVNVTVYYDSNFNFMPEPAEGIVDVAVFLYDNATGRLIAFGYTNDEGRARFDSIATTGAIRVEVPFLNFRQIVGAGESNILLRVAPQPLPIGIP
jgi:hypothetical protein